VGVLLVVPGGITPHGRGDIIPALMHLVLELAARCSVCVLSLSDSVVPQVIRTPSFLLINPGRSRPRGLIGLWLDSRHADRLLAHNGAEFDVIHSFWFGRPSLVAQYLSRAHRVPWVASLGGQELSEQRLAGMSRAARSIQQVTNGLALRYADKLTAGSRMSLDAIASMGKPGTWLPLFSEAAPAEPNIRSRTSNGAFKIVTVADHNDAKDPDTLLKVISLLSMRGRDVTLDWIGQELSPGCVEAKAAELGIAPRVHVHGHVPHDRVYEHLRRADLYLQSSRYESQGVAVCEAAAAGLPIVGTNTGILAELAPEHAISVEIGDAQALVHAIERLMDDSEYRTRLANRAAAWMASYSVQWTASTALALYEELVGRH
jgi:glycosyltransferase involved in cell wall biosynthesis